MPCRTGQSFPDCHIPALEPCIHAGYQCCIEEKTNNVTGYVESKQETIKKDRSDTGYIHKSACKNQRENKCKEDKGHKDSGDDREQEELFIIHKNIPARFNECKASADAFKHMMYI